MENKEINYLNKDFKGFKNQLVNYAKAYFPNTYNDFSPSSTGMLFIEMAAYVGDVLSFYLDNQLQETFIQYARQKENLYNLAYMLGYSPRVTTAASTYIDLYQLLPATLSGSINVPDYSYCLSINENTKVSSTTNNSVEFLIQDKTDFAFSSSLDPTEVSVYQVVGDQPSFYLLKKTRKAISATINTTSFTITTPERFKTIEINSSNIIGILDIIDSNGNKWEEVQNLSQDFIYDSTINNEDSDAPFILKLKSVSRRFVSRFINENTLQIQFGSGIVNNLDEEIIPNPNNVGLGLPFEQNKLNTAYSPLNFIFTDAYGSSPHNIVLTVRYLTGGGLTSNVPQNYLTIIDTTNIKFNNSNISDSVLAQTIFDSIACNNPKAADGGQDGDDIEEIRINSLASFQSQLRTVTKDDYVVRALSLPSSYGSLAKVYAELENASNYDYSKPNYLNLYILSYDSNKNLRFASNTLKQNLKTYLSQYRIINDSIRIKDAIIINIGIDFDIITLPNYNNNDVILRCINQLKEFFDINKWQINQPIILRDLYILLDKVKGVQTVKNINIINKTGNSLGYSNYGYDIEGANYNNVIYPSLDPMIFEVKYPNVDINGRVVPM